MSEVERLVQQLCASFEGEAWAGPSVREALNDVSVVTASQRAFRDGHTIWELVLHLISNDRMICDRLAGSRFASPTPAELWSLQPYPTDAGWQQSLCELETTHLMLRKAMAQVPDAQLAQKLPGRDHTWFDELNGCAQHNMYHAGQIVLLKKALR
jgi:uncharacterized damage-inducible protein DinB